MAAQHRLPVGYDDVLGGRYGRAPGGAALGAGTGLPVGLADVFIRRSVRAPARAAVGAGAPLPVGLVDAGMAAEGGHLEVLQWAVEHNCPWDSDTCSFAAGAGRLEVLQWVRQHDATGEAWDEDCVRANAAGPRKPEVLTWLDQLSAP